MSIKVFNNQYDVTETWSAQGAIVLWGTGTEIGIDGSGASGVFPLLMSGITVNYARRSQEVPAINVNADGKRRRYRIYDAPVGNMGITSIFSPYARDLKAFIEAVTKDCKQEDDQVWMSVSPFGTLSCVQGDSEIQNVAANNPTFGTFGLKNVDLEALNLQITGGAGGGATINLPLNFSFTALDWNID